MNKKNSDIGKKLGSKLLEMSQGKGCDSYLI